MPEPHDLRYEVPGEVTTREQFKWMALRLGGDEPFYWEFRGPLHYTFKDVQNLVDVIHDEETGRCRLNAALEFYRPSKDPEYAEWMERCFEHGRHDLSEPALSACANIFYRKRFRSKFPHAYNYGCDVEDVHVHAEWGTESKEHVHISCRRDIQCLDAFKIAPQILGASQRLHKEG